MARPLKPGNEKRTEKFEMRLTPAEKTQLWQMADDASLSPTDYVRGQTFGTKPMRRKPGPDRKGLLVLGAELGKLGSNVNQIAHVLNTYALNGERLDRLPEDFIRNVMYGVETLTRALHNELRNGH